MKKENLSLYFFRYNDENELSDEDKNLMKMAHEATNNSYVPYSKFRVGAAVLLENGKIVTGSNVENSAYPSGLCAERVALFTAMAQYPHIAIKKLAITARTEHVQINDPVMPCGACRQVMVEVEKISKQPLQVLCQGATGEVLLFESTRALMPFSFDEKYL